MAPQNNVPQPVINDYVQRYYQIRARNDTADKLIEVGLTTTPVQSPAKSGKKHHRDRFFLLRNYWYTAKASKRPWATKTSGC